MNNFWTGFEKAASEPKQVAAVALIKDGKILMGRRRDNGKWTNPGGHIEKGEDPRSGAVREVKEECGIDLNPSSLRHVKTENVKKPSGEKLIIHAYKAPVGGKRPTTMQEDPDGEVYRWHWVGTADGIRGDILDKLHVPKEENVLLKALGLNGEEKKAAPGRIARLTRNVGDTVRKPVEEFAEEWGGRSVHQHRAEDENDPYNILLDAVRRKYNG